MNKHQFTCAVAEILEISPEGLSGQEELESIGNWDSLSIISFVAMVDADLNQSIDPEKLKQARTLDDLASLVTLT
jgi:acyl carrier protein